MRTLSRNWLRSRILFRLIQRIKKDIKGEKGYSYAYLNISVGIYRETIGIGKNAGAARDNSRCRLHLNLNNFWFNLTDIQPGKNTPDSSETCT
jgi:hypothetical protein